FQAEDGIRDPLVTGVQTCALPISNTPPTPGHVFQVTCAASCASFTWANKTGNLPDIPVDSIIVNPNNGQQVFAGSDWGVYYTNEIGRASCRERVHNAVVTNEKKQK